MDDYEEDDIPENRMEVSDYREIFRSAGFSGDRLGWNGRSYPRVSVRFCPDPWGRQQPEVWVDAVYVTSADDERGRGLPAGEMMTLMDDKQARDLAAEWAERARREVGDAEEEESPSEEGGDGTLRRR